MLGVIGMRLIACFSLFFSLSVLAEDPKELISKFNQLDPVKDESARKEILLKILDQYDGPTPEQMLSVAFKMRDQALLVVSSPEKKDCMLNPKTVKEDEVKKECVVCSFFDEKNPDKKIMFLGNMPTKNGIFSPDEVSITYNGLNDQPMHGLSEKFYNIGDDVNGHTYGSNLNVKLDYDWGNFTFDYGSDLYVLSYDTMVNGKNRHYTTSDGTRKFLQEADEHTYFRFGTLLYLDPKEKINLGENGINKYVKFGLAYEIDSDQGIGKLGAISHREWWHSIGGARNNEYINHRVDRDEYKVDLKYGTEFYYSMWKLGFCSSIEGGLSASTTGRVSLASDLKAQINSGTLLGFSRTDPLFAINVKAGIYHPLKAGSEGSIENDPRYNPFLTNRNYSMIGDLNTAYGSVGVEIGGKNIRFAVDAIVEKNKWSDRDVLWMTSLKIKF